MDKEIISDEKGKPIAVRIAYRDWLEIEAILPEHLVAEKAEEMDIMRFSGSIKGGEDPMAFQQRMRDEWP